MPKSSKPRKQYRPHGINARAHVVAMMGAAALHIDDRTVWALALDSAITSVARGKASQQEWSCIFAAAALLEDLVKAGKARDPDDIVRHAEDACIAITTRYRLGQRAVRAQELAHLPVEIEQLRRKRTEVREELKAVLTSYLKQLDIDPAEVGGASDDDLSELFQSIPLGDDEGLGPMEIAELESK